MQYFTNYNFKDKSACNKQTEYNYVLDLSYELK